MDETYILVRSHWKYLYWAVDKAGHTIDFLLRAQHDKAAARRIFEKAIAHNGQPDSVTIDGSPANLAGPERHQRREGSSHRHSTGQIPEQHRRAGLSGCSARNQSAVAPAYYCLLTFQQW